MNEAAENELPQEGPGGRLNLTVPYRFPDVLPIVDVIRDYSDIEPEAVAEGTVRVAGRVMRFRGQGKLIFAELRDGSGAIQLFVEQSTAEDFESFKLLNLGDWIGVSGTPMRTKRGELSVKVQDWSLLAPAHRGFGDKWKGISDPELRYRQREVDLWANEGVRQIFLQRSEIIKYIRRFLDEKGFIEVETPILQAVEGGATAKPFITHHNALHADLSLRIALELYLKRALVGGFEKVYELGRVFRNEGLSPRHNPEFTMLELYEAYADYTDMMDMVEQLVSYVCLRLHGKTVITYQGQEVDLTPPWRRAGMEELIFEATSETVNLSMTRAEVAEVADRLKVAYTKNDGAGKIILEIYEKTTEPNLIGPVHVYDYPKEVSPLARDHRSKSDYVERFETVIVKRELANAFSELNDPIEQRVRLEAQAILRAAGDEEAMAVDEDFLRALEHGMPPTGGLGVGIDRLVMLLTDQPNIKEVILFPALRKDERQ
ncbi:MAG: lysine--tRNA ligase [Firmicutes bacterium]|nr:lysine--tRNA ligase [Bacillota bacterium]